MSTTGSDFGGKGEKDLAVWKRKHDESRKKTLDKKEYLL